MDKRTNQKVCGRWIGTATDWDQIDTFIITLFGFEPHPDYKGPKANCINIDFEGGYIEEYDEDGECVDRADLITALKDCPVLGN